MVEFYIPLPIDNEIYQLIPEQRKQVQILFNSGKLVAYSLAADKSKLWALIVASSESELIQIIDTLPLTKYIDYNYSELMFHQSLKLLPAMSLN